MKKVAVAINRRTGEAIKRLSAPRGRVEAMAGSTSTARATDSAAASKVPIARPPEPSKPSPPHTTSSLPSQSSRDCRSSTGNTGLPRSGRAGPARSRRMCFCSSSWAAGISRRDWTGRPRFDSRLAGSPNGVSESDQLTGGLNTPLSMPAAPEVEAELALTSPTLAPLELASLEPRDSGGGAKNPSGGGGRPNSNPGAGDGDGFGLARFGEGGEVIRGVQVKVGDPQFTLIWNSDNVDLDLHVLEPGGKEIFWEEPQGQPWRRARRRQHQGYGPENVYWLVESDGPGSEKVKGPGPPGIYKWYVVYWGGFGGIAKPTHWQVRVKHNGQVQVYHGKFSALNERSKIYTLKVDPPPGGKPVIPACRIRMRAGDLP